MNKNNDKGFTLVELLVVMAIIGLLIAIALSGLNIARQNQRNTTRKAITQDIQSQIESFYGNNGQYPADVYTPALSADTGGTGDFKITPAGTGTVYNVTVAADMDSNGAGANFIKVDESNQKDITGFDVATNAAANTTFVAQIFCSTTTFTTVPAGAVAEGIQSNYHGCYNVNYDSNSKSFTGYALTVALEGTATHFCLSGGSYNCTTNGL